MARSARTRGARTSGVATGTSDAERRGKAKATRRRNLAAELRLPAKAVRRTLDPAELPFETTTELAPLHLGSDVQSRAVDALELGLGLRSRGYHIFVIGESDSGKTSTVRKLLERRAASEATPPDLCYVRDFESPDRPRPLEVPAGQGPRLAAAMDELVAELQKAVPKALTSDAFALRRSTVVGRFRRQVDDIRARLEEEAGALNLVLRQEGDSIVPVPLAPDGQALSEEDFAALPPEGRARYEAAMHRLQDRMSEYDLHQYRIEREMERALLDEEQAVIAPVVARAASERLRMVGDLAPLVPRFLERVVDHATVNHRRFLPLPDEEGGDEETTTDGGEDDLFAEYRINVLVTRTPGTGAPVVFERNPTLGRVVGCLEPKEARGALKTDHMSIRAGALHRAAGGYVVFQVSDLSRKPASWEALKRALRDREVRIDEPEDEGRQRTAGSVRPEPTPLGAKVVLIGTPETYYALFAVDEEVGRLFKVKAEFEPSIPWTRANVMRLARFLALVAEQEKLLPLHRTAVARAIEHAAWDAADQRRLSTRVAAILDVVAEADYRARKARRTAVTAADIEAALAGRRRRHSGDEDSILRVIKDGALLVSTSGAVVGQINGTAVYDTGDHAFGVPTRITARTWVGRSGVVNIDREVELSGQIHDKGTLIMIGLLGDRYAQGRPLSLAASITFEQSYDLVEGDSASCAEFFAILSSLSGLPIRQGMAVTGSVNQQGEVQPVGGVNEKIEGMYRVCKMRGLTGDQGVVIPRRNVRNLMLPTEVVEAIAAGRFNVWAIDTVDEGIELLTGVPAGKRRRDGSWEPGTVNGLADARLAEMAKSLRSSRPTE